MLALVPGETQLLAGLELGGVPSPRPCRWRAGTARPVRAQGGQELWHLPCRRGRRGGPAACVLLVEDVITTGGAVADAVGLVEAAGAQVIGVVCAIWRGEGAPHIAALPDLPVHAVLTRAALERA